MINLQIHHFTHSESFYFVSLGNGTKFQFKSEKECQKFLVKTSKFLTQKFNELNLLFAQVFNLYRQNYFYFDNNRHKQHAQLYQNRRIINGHIQTIEKDFENLSFINLHSDGNQSTFRQLNHISDKQIEICLIIKSLNKSKSFVSVDIMADSLINSIVSVKNQLQTYSIHSSISFDVSALNQSVTSSQSLLKIVS